MLPLGRAPTPPLSFMPGATDVSASHWRTVVVSGGRACFFAFYYPMGNIGYSFREEGNLWVEKGYFHYLRTFGTFEDVVNETYNCWPRRLLPEGTGSERQPPPPDAGLVWNEQHHRMLLIWNGDREQSEGGEKTGKVSLASLASTADYKSDTLPIEHGERDPPVEWIISVLRPKEMEANWTTSMKSFVVCPKEDKNDADDDDGNNGGGKGGESGGGGGGNGVSPGKNIFSSKIFIFSVLAVVLALAIIFFGYRLLQERFSVGGGCGGKKLKIKVCFY